MLSFPPDRLVVGVAWIWAAVFLNIDSLPWLAALCFECDSFLFCSLCGVVTFLIHLFPTVISTPVPHQYSNSVSIYYFDQKWRYAWKYETLQNLIYRIADTSLVMQYLKCNEREKYASYARQRAMTNPLVSNRIDWLTLNILNIALSSRTVARKSSKGPLHLCRGAWHSQIWPNTTDLYCSVFQFGTCSFVWGVRPTKTPRGDGTASIPMLYACYVVQGYWSVWCDDDIEGHQYHACNCNILNDFFIFFANCKYKNGDNHIVKLSFVQQFRVKAFLSVKVFMIFRAVFSWCEAQG